VIPYAPPFFVTCLPSTRRLGTRCVSDLLALGGVPANTRSPPRARRGRPVRTRAPDRARDGRPAPGMG
jgi:hypothetical protein